MKKVQLLLGLFSLILSVTRSTYSISTQTPIVAYSISGYIRDNISDGINEVKLVLSGNISLTVLTDFNGYYRFENIPAGNYTITPSKNGFTFLEPSITYTDLSENQTNQNYKGSTGVIIYDIETYDTNTNHSVISWKTNVPATTSVEYGITADYGSRIDLTDTTVTIEHDAQLFNLISSSTYHFRVISGSYQGGKYYYSGDNTFVTIPHNQILIDKKQTYCYPNPCKKKTTFSYYLFESVDSITINILTLSGKKIAQLQSNALNKGKNEFIWNLKDNSGSRLPANLYLYQINIKKGVFEEKVKRTLGIQ